MKATASALVREKGISAALVLGTGAVLGPVGVTIMTSVLGQAHFLATYLYQYRAGKVTRRSLTLYATCFAGIFGGFALYPNSMLLLGLASSYFILHFVQDEKFLAGQPPFVTHSVPQALEMGMVLVAYLGLILETTTELPVARWFACASLGMAALWIGFKVRKREPFTLVNGYFLLLTLGLCCVKLLGLKVSFNELVGHVVTFHYMNWYLHYFFKPTPDRGRRRRYVVEMLMINVGVILTFALTYGQLLPYGLRSWVWSHVYSIDAFNQWTLLHLIFTTRFRSPQRA